MERHRAQVGEERLAGLAAVSSGGAGMRSLLRLRLFNLFAELEDVSNCVHE